MLSERKRVREREKVTERGGRDEGGGGGGRREKRENKCPALKDNATFLFKKSAANIA